MKGFSSLLIVTIILLFSPHSSYAAKVVDLSINRTESMVKQSIEETSRFNVLFHSHVDLELLDKYKATIIYTYEKIPAVTIELQPKLIDQLSQERKVKSVREDQLVKAVGQIEGWGLNAVQLAKKYPTNLTGRGIKIAVIDSGIDYTHPDLKVAGGKCVLDLVVDNEGGVACARSYYDDDGHGTHVAGIIAAQDNDIGVLGVAPDASIYAIKALDRKGYGTTSSVMAALDWAMKNKVNIINMSLLYKEEEPAIRELIRKAYKQGILLVAAAGNERHPTGKESNVLYPAKYPEVIAVSSMGENYDIIATSSIGKEVELTAPGGWIYSTKPLSQGSYGTMSGTSMAAPFVSGLAALYMEKYPELDAEEIRQLLHMNAKDLGTPGRDVRFGYGLAQVDTTIKNETSVMIQESKDMGTVHLEIRRLPEEAKGYNLYRYDKKIIANGTESTIEDYGVKGRIRYKLVPLINGKEDLKTATVFHADLATPAIKDVSNEYWFSRNIVYLNLNKIMNGYATGEMKPLQQMTRTEAVILLVNALDLPLDATQMPFKDVVKNSTGSGHIGAAVKNGIIKGFADGTFRGQQTVTRAEMSMMIAKGFNLSPATKTPLFKDVNPNIAGYEQINQVAFHKIAEGYSDGTFRPNEKMTRGTFAVFLSKAKNEKLK